MVSGIKTFPKSLEQSVEDRLAVDPHLKKQWQEVTTRFYLVYADPQAAFKTIDVDAMLNDPVKAEAAVAALSSRPEAFGRLTGGTGMFATKADRQARDTAIVNAPALARNIARYLEARTSAERRYEANERSERLKISVDIPALSSTARQTLGKIRDAIDRNDLPSGLEYALADKMVKAELEGFARAISKRFGERTFLGLAAKDSSGESFRTVTAGMSPTQKAQVQSAWQSMRTAQQLAAHEHIQCLKQAQTLRQGLTKGLSLK